MAEKNVNSTINNENEVKELDLNDLDQVSGAGSLSSAPRVKNHDYSELDKNRA